MDTQTVDPLNITIMGQIKEMCKTEILKVTPLKARTLSLIFRHLNDMNDHYLRLTRLGEQPASSFNT